MLWIGDVIINRNQTFQVESYLYALCKIITALLFSLPLLSSTKTTSFLLFQEPLQGKIVIKSSSSISHYGLRLTINGSVNLQVSPFSLNYILFYSWRRIHLFFFFLWIVRFVEDLQELLSRFMVLSNRLILCMLLIHSFICCVKCSMMKIN